MSQCHVGGKFFCHLQGQGHSEDSFDQNMTFFFMFWTVDSLATRLGLMIYIIIRQSVLWINWITAFRVKGTMKSQNVNVCPDGVF